MLPGNTTSALRRGIALKSFVILLLLGSATLPVVTFAVGEKFPVVPEDGYAVVSRGPMELVISQSGEVDSADNEILISKCEFSTRIISIVPEGSWVEAGDIVAELDSSDLKKRLNEREILLVNATARLSDAQEDLRIQTLTNESIVADAELQARLSKLQLDGYIEAEYPQKLHSLEAGVALAEEDLARAKKQYDFVNDMVRLGYRTQSDRENERINVMKKQQAFTLAEDKLTVLRDFTYERTLTQLRAVAAEAERELDRVQLASKASILRREINVRSRQRSHDIYANYQDRLRKNIEACTIRATKSGEVIYARLSSSSSQRVDEGTSMRYLQPIVKIPDRDRLQVKVRIHESNIRHIERGQAVVINVDAAGRNQYVGHVHQISRVPLAGRRPNYHLREYSVTINVDADPEAARTIAPGMTATADIIAAQRDSAVQAAMQSIVQIGDEYVVFVKEGDEIEPRTVEVGISSDDTIEILDGLSEGETIVFKPRVTCTQRILALQSIATEKKTSSIWLTQN